MKNVIVDLGNMEIKFLGDFRGKFSSKYTTRFEINPDAYERIDIDGVQTLIGVGEFEREFNKVEKNILPQVLYSIIVNGQARTTKINKCVILPESQSAYYSLDNPSPYQLLIDIGSRTIGWCIYEDGKMVNSGTERLGIFDLYNTIMIIENAKGNDFRLEDIEGQVKRGRIKVEDRVYKEFLLGVLNRIKSSVNIKNYDCMFLGGGSIVLESIIRSIPNVEIHPNPVYANVIGCEVVCKKAWR